MPIYEYRCKKGHTFEVLQKLSDDPVTKCEVCGAPVGRVFHPVAVHFKGSGFYNTDYGTRKRAREQKETAGASSGSGGDSGGSGGDSGGSGGESSTSSSDSKSDTKKSDSKAASASSSSGD
jgi:putative FmdB family regulatory protein